MAEYRCSWHFLKQSHCISLAFATPTFHVSGIKWNIIWQFDPGSSCVDMPTLNSTLRREFVFRLFSFENRHAFQTYPYLTRKLNGCLFGIWTWKHWIVISLIFPLFSTQRDLLSVMLSYVSNLKYVKWKRNGELISHLLSLCVFHRRHVSKDFDEFSYWGFSLKHVSRSEI